MNRRPSEFSSLRDPCESLAFAVVPPSSEAIQGLLRFDPRTGTRFEYVPATTSPVEFMTLSEQRFECVAGEMVDGTPFTLIDCWPTGLSWRQSGRCTAALVAGRLVVGSKLGGRNDPMYCGAEIELEGLAYWLAAEPFKLEKEISAAGMSGHQVTVTHAAPDAMGFSYLAEGISLQVVSRLSHESDRITSYRMLNSPRVLLGLRSPVSLDEIQRLLHWTRCFFALLSGTPMWTTRIRLIKTRADRKDRLLCRVPQGPSPEFSSTSLITLLSMPRIRSQLGDLWCRWLERRSKYTIAANLHLSAQDLTGENVEFGFLTAMQSLESLHRHRFPGCYLSAQDYSEVYEQISNAIPAQIDPALQQALRSRLKFGNELSLRKRLLELYRTLPIPVAKSLHSNMDAFIEEAVRVRNLLTHYHDDSQFSAIDWTAVYGSTRVLRWLFCATLLKDLGVSTDLLESAFQNEARVMGLVPHRLNK